MSDKDKSITELLNDSRIKQALSMINSQGAVDVASVESQIDRSVNKAQTMRDIENATQVGAGITIAKSNAQQNNSVQAIDTDQQDKTYNTNNDKKISKDEKDPVPSPEKIKAAAHFNKPVSQIGQAEIEQYLEEMKNGYKISDPDNSFTAPLVGATSQTSSISPHLSRSLVKSLVPTITPINPDQIFTAKNNEQHDKMDEIMWGNLKPTPTPAMAQASKNKQYDLPAQENCLTPDSPSIEPLAAGGKPVFNPVAKTSFGDVVLGKEGVKNNAPEFTPQGPLLSK